MTAQPHPHRSPRPQCPDPCCRKVWAPDKRTAKQLRAEIIAEKGGAAEHVRYYEHAGGWHWTRRLDKPQRQYF